MADALTKQQTTGSMDLADVSILKQEHQQEPMAPLPISDPMEAKAMKDLLSEVIELEEQMDKVLTRSLHKFMRKHPVQPPQGSPETTPFTKTHGIKSDGKHQNLEPIRTQRGSQGQLFTEGKHSGIARTTLRQTTSLSHMLMAQLKQSKPSTNR